MRPLLEEIADSPVDGARVWQASTASLTMAEIDQLHVYLDNGERERASRFHFARDRNEYVATRALLRSLLAGLTNTSPETLEFSYGTHGKPQLAVPQDADLRFNVTHSAGHIMFAVASAREVGIDLESLARFDDRGDDLMGLAQRVLSQRELASWCEVPHDARRESFLRAWTRKEACAKSSGCGGSVDFRELETLGDFVVSADQRWHLHDLRAPAGFVAALAVESPSRANQNQPHAQTHCAAPL